MHADRGAFFGSVCGTLNHLLVADTIWLKRFADHPARFQALDTVHPLPRPYSLTEPVHARFDDVQKARFTMDDILIALATEATDDAYAQTLTYANRAGPSNNDVPALRRNTDVHRCSNIQSPRQR